MQACVNLKGDLIDLAMIVETCNEDGTLPLPIWWGGTFCVFAKECFRAMGIDVAVTDIHEPPRWDDIKDSDIKMTKQEFRDYLFGSACDHNDTSFEWHVTSILPKEGGTPEQRCVEMGVFEWYDDFKKEDLERLANSEE